jgi:hypothetical protein
MQWISPKNRPRFSGPFFFCLARVGGQGLFGVSRLHLPCLTVETVSSEMAPGSGVQTYLSALELSYDKARRAAEVHAIDPDSTGSGSGPC